MVDREKVFRALDCMSRDVPMPCNGCAYFIENPEDPDTGWCDIKTAAADALTLLNEISEKLIKAILEEDKDEL